MRQHGPWWTLAVSTLALSSACQPLEGLEDAGDSGSPDGLSDAGATDDADAATSSGADAGSSFFPDSPAGEQLAWIVELLNGRISSVSNSELREHLSDSLAALLPVAELRATLADYSQNHMPFQPLRWWTTPTSTRIVVVVHAEGWERAIIGVQVAAEPPHGIVELFIEERPELAPEAPQSWEAFATAYGNLAPGQSVLATELDLSGCREVYAQEPDAVRAIGSTFKLFVLLALIEAIDRGDLRWDDGLVLHDEWRSLPTGALWNALTGTPFSVEELTYAMIAASDNTAADHLLFTLGRAAVETQVVTLQSPLAEGNSPFLATRELFTLKLQLTDEERTAYLALSSDARLDFLENELPVLNIPEALQQAALWNTPRFIDQLEWFASTRDLCRTMDRLHELTTSDPDSPLLSVMTLNPGLRLNPEQWPVVAYKGGSEPGVLNLTWLLQRADQRWFVLVLSANDPLANINQPLALEAALVATEILAGS